LLKVWDIKTNECLNTYDEHSDKIWALCANSDESKYLTGSADAKIILWKNITGEIHEQEMEKREEILLKEQELMNCLKDKKYKKALKLAIILDRPFKCYEIINEILSNKEYDGKNDLKEIIVKLREDHVQTLLKYSIDWNTNSKYCHNSQALIEILLNSFSPEYLKKLNNFSNLIEQFLPYTGILVFLIIFTNINDIYIL
jgi:U3 small nucleolar RNA-associated protein 13